MGNDPRNEDNADDAPISVDQAIRAARTATSMGRAPKPQATAKIGKYDLEKAIEKSREGAANPPEPEPEPEEEAHEATAPSDRDPSSPT